MQFSRSILSLDLSQHIVKNIDHRAVGDRLLLVLVALATILLLILDLLEDVNQVLLGEEHPILLQLLLILPVLVEQILIGRDTDHNVGELLFSDYTIFLVEFGPYLAN